jgi:hypothetical protein
MAVTTEDVQEFVKQAWGQNATLLPIMLVNGKYTGQDTDQTYTEFTVKDGATEFNATAPYTQLFNLEFKTWGQEGATNLGPIKLAIEAAFSLRLPAVPTTITLPSGRTLYLMRSFKAAGELQEDDATQQGQSVMLATDRYEILCQG